MCCGYGTAGLGTMGYDCIIIPGAAKVAGAIIISQAFCGRDGLATAATSGSMTVCSMCFFLYKKYLVMT
jgi:hypothetical protein